MIILVEYDEEGNIFHVCEIHTTEGRDVDQLKSAMNPTEKKKYQDQVDTAIKVREIQTRNELHQHVTNGKPLVVLPEGSSTPNSEIHKVDLTTKQIRLMTAAEQQARDDARNSQSVTQ